MPLAAGRARSTPVQHVRAPATKPCLIVRLVAGRRHDTSTEDCIAALNQAGYEHRGVPGREFFLGGQPRKYHLHLVEDLHSPVAFQRIPFASEPPSSRPLA